MIPEASLADALQQGRVTGFNPDRAQRTEQADKRQRRAANSRVLVLVSQPLILGSWFLVRGSWFLVLSSWFLALGPWFLVRGPGRNLVGGLVVSPGDEWDTVLHHGVPASVLILYIDGHLYKVLFLLEIHMSLGILHHLSARLGCQICGLDLPAALLPHLSAIIPRYQVLHELYAMYSRVAAVRWRQAAYHLSRLHGLAGTCMDACTVQYVACGGAVIMYRLAETRAGLCLTLGPKGLRCRSKALFAGRIE